MKIILTIILLLFSAAAQSEKSSVALYVCQGVTDEMERDLCISRATQTISDRNREITSGETKGISLGLFSLFWPWAWWLLYYGFGILIGLYLLKDCKSREWVFLGVRPIYWLLLAALDPALTLIAYWLMHYSRFALSYSEAITSINEPPKKNEL